MDRIGFYPVECGDTNPAKLEKYRASPSVKHLAIIPYPKQDQIRGFLFSTADNFSEYIKFKENALREKLRKNTHK